MVCTKRSTQSALCFRHKEFHLDNSSARVWMKEKRCEILEGKRGIPHGSSSSRYGHKRIVFLLKKKKSEFQTFYTVADFEFVFLPDYYWKTGIFLINTLSIGFAATLWLRGITHTESRGVLVNGFGLFWNLIKSLIANSTPPMWLHFPFTRRPRTAEYVHSARNTSHIGENSRTALLGVFFIEWRTFSIT